MAYGGDSKTYLDSNNAQVKGKDVVNDKGEKIGYVNGDGSIRDKRSGNYYEPKK